MVTYRETQRERERCGNIQIEKAGGRKREKVRSGVIQREKERKRRKEILVTYL